MMDTTPVFSRWVTTVFPQHRISLPPTTTSTQSRLRLRLPRGLSGVSLAKIARRELAPYAGDNVEILGPSVTLKAEAAQAMAMVLHELTTNAAKYGAFSDRNGRVSLRWRWLRNGSTSRLAIDWQEIGGPQVLPPRQHGYGTGVISELIPFELGGTVELAFPGDGVRCRMEIPAEWVSGAAPLDNEAKGWAPQMPSITARETPTLPPQK